MSKNNQGHVIKKWAAIQDQFRDALLLGNGASRAVHSGFGYDSLYEAATQADHISRSVATIFEQFKTQDFELVLRRLWQAQLVNKALRIAGPAVDEAYKNVQNALIWTIRDTHVTYDQAKLHFEPIYQFIKNFKTVVSLNYDLVLYWATQFGNQELGIWFKDGFIDGAFDDGYERLREAYNAPGATLFFYPHGNLVLARNNIGQETKIAASSFSALLATFREAWDDASPIFVCEGTASDKKQTIGNSSYLQRVYREVIPSLSDSLVIYGWNMHTQDQHILDQLKLSKIKRVAISVHENNQKYAGCAYEKVKAMGITDENITFFDAASSGCWNNVS